MIGNIPVLKTSEAKRGACNWRDETFSLISGVFFHVVYSERDVLTRWETGNSFIAISCQMWDEWRKQGRSQQRQKGKVNRYSTESVGLA